MERSRAEALLRNRGWLSGRPTTFQDAVLKRAKLTKFSRGEPLYRLDDAGGGIFGAVAGGFLLSVPLAGLTIAPAHVATTGLWFGFGPAFSQIRRTFDVVSMQESYALTVSPGAIAEINEIAPENAFHWASLAAVASQIAIDCIADLLIADSKKRAAAVLLRITGGIDHPIDEEFLISQQLLAEISNTSRLICIKVITELQERGAISKTYGKMLIIDRSKIYDYIIQRS